MKQKGTFYDSYFYRRVDGRRTRYLRYSFETVGMTVYDVNVSEHGVVSCAVNGMRCRPAPIHFEIAERYGIRNADVCLTICSARNKMEKYND